MADRATYIGAPQLFNLHNACRLIGDAFGHGHTYLVGSALHRRDFRDVDVRFIMKDDAFKALFPGAKIGLEQFNARLSLLNAAISEWLSGVSGLPVDFQFQSRTEANQHYQGRRNALGIYIAPDDADDTGGGEDG